MKKHNHTWVAPFVGLTFLLMATPLWGQNKQITIADAISHSLENYGELIALREERGINEAAKTKAGLLPNPVLEVGGGTGSLTGSSSENSVYLSLSQEFLTGDKRGKRSQIATKDLDRFDSDVIDAERLLRLKVKTVCYDLLLAHNRLELAHKANERNSRLLRIAGQRLASGEVAELDLNLVKVEAARGEGRKIEAEREITPAQQQLLILIGEAAEEELNLSSPLDAGFFSWDLIELKKLAVENRPNLKTLKIEAEKAGMEVLLAKAERMPNVTAGLAYSRENSLTSLGGLEESSTDNLIGLKVSIPLPVFDSNQAGYLQAVARKKSAETRYLFALKTIAREVGTAHAHFDSAQQSVALYRTGIIPQLEQNLQLVADAYQLGEIEILALIEEQKKFIEVNESYLTALYNWNVAVAQVEAAVGLELKKYDGENI